MTKKNAKGKVSKPKGEIEREEIITLNNKSRKGKYLYIKEKGKQGRYYKLQDEKETQAIKEYYKDKYKPRRKLKGTVSKYKKAYVQKDIKKWKEYKISKALKKQAETYLKKIQKTPTLTDSIRAGLTSVTINNILKADGNTTKKAYKQLLQDLIIDKKLVDIITSRENIQKLKSRFENIIRIHNTKGQVETTAKKFNTTPEDIIREIQNRFMESQEIEYPERILREMGYQTEGKTDKIKIGRISLEIIFRKGGKEQ